MRIPWVVCGWSSSHIFCQKRVRNSSGRQKSACKLLNNLLILISCFIASEVPSLGMGRHHILSFEELFPQISSFDMIFESTPHFFNFQGWMSQFWKQLIPFFRNKRCLTPCPHVPLYPQLYHSHSFPVPWIGTFLLPRRIPPKYICKRKIIGLTESSIFLDVTRTNPYRSFAVFKGKEHRFKKEREKTSR